MSLGKIYAVCVNGGLLTANRDAKLIGWDLPYVSQEQLMRFGLHGYTALCNSLFELLTKLQ